MKRKRSREYQDRLNAYQRERTKKFVEWMRDLKALSGCLRCGERDPRCLDFHHRDPEHKEYLVSRMARHAKETILREIEKCDILCANCHRKITR